MKVLAVDPGPRVSGYLIWIGEKIQEKGILPNQDILDILAAAYFYEARQDRIVLVVEDIVCMGMAVGKTTLDTAWWSGRFCQAWEGEHVLIPRMDVKMHLCNNSRAKDANIRQSLIDRYEPDLIGKQRPRGILKGVRGHEWSALSLAVFYMDTHYGKIS